MRDGVQGELVRETERVIEFPVRSSSFEDQLYFSALKFHEKMYKYPFP